MKYKKDYSVKTPEEWLAEKSWVAFLMSLPFNRARVFMCENVLDIVRIRTSASMITKRKDAGRRFRISTDDDFSETRLFTVLVDKVNG